jgi:hypothetical protein
MEGGQLAGAEALARVPPRKLTPKLIAQTLPLIHGTHGKPRQAPGQVNADQRGSETNSPQSAQRSQRKRKEARA